ncbi:hypothetical protein AVEN_94579-1, partial [Araneus ventricosus]
RRDLALHRKRDTAIIFGKLRATSTSDTEQLSEIQRPPEFSEIQRPPEFSEIQRLLEFSEIQNTDEGTFGIASNSWRCLNPGIA